jgi:hypothetical protein
MYAWYKYVDIYIVVLYSIEYLKREREIYTYVDRQLQWWLTGTMIWIWANRNLKGSLRCGFKCCPAVFAQSLAQECRQWWSVSRVASITAWYLDSYGGNHNLCHVEHQTTQVTRPCGGKLFPCGHYINYVGVFLTYILCGPKNFLKFETLNQTFSTQK